MNHNYALSTESRSSLQDIPQEVLLRILTYLDVEGLIAFSSLCNYFRDVYQHATLIVYRTALLEAGMMDISDASTSPSFTIPSRLALLKQRREVWRTLQMMHRYDPDVKENVAKPLYVRINFNTSSIYDFSAGVYVLGERRTSYRDTGAVRFLDLSKVRAEGEALRKEMDSMSSTWGKVVRDVVTHQWPSVKVPREERIVDFGLALREHDLIALITETPCPVGFAVTMHLRQLSTGRDHPLARVPSIYLRTPRYGGELAIMLEVSGPNLVLLLTTSRRTAAEDERDWLAVYNWYTGEQITATTSRPRTWQGFVFLTNEHILLPNAHTVTLDIIKLPKYPSVDVATPAGVISNPDLFTKLLSLRLPRLLPGVRISSVLCRSEPNPFGAPHPDAGKYNLSLRRGEDAYHTDMNGDKHPYIKGTPLAASPESSIILFRFYMDEQLTAQRFVHTFFVHRSSIVNVLREREVAASQAVPGPIGTEQVPEDDEDLFDLHNMVPGNFNVVFVPPAPVAPPAEAPADQGDDADDVDAALAQEDVQVNAEDLMELAELMNPNGAQDAAEFQEVEMMVEEEEDEWTTDEEGSAHGDGAGPVVDEGDDGGHNEEMETDSEVAVEDMEVVEADTDAEDEEEEEEEEEGDEGDFAELGFPADFVQMITQRVANLRRRRTEALNKQLNGEPFEEDPNAASTSSNSRDIPWSAWGPDITRWAPEELARSHWVTTTCGQRAVLEGDARLIVWDFNPYSVKRERHRARAEEREREREKEKMAEKEVEKEVEVDHGGEDGNRDEGSSLEQRGAVKPERVHIEVEEEEEEEEEENTEVEHVSIRVVEEPSVEKSSRSTPTFCEPVVSKLPYVEARTPHGSNYKYNHGVMLDEDHVVGINSERSRDVVEVYSV